MSNDDSKEIHIQITGREKLEPPIQRVVCEAEVAKMVMGMGTRLSQGFHDMIVLFGPRDQSGPERYVQSASLVLNDRRNSSLLNANEAALDAVHQYQDKGHPDAVILGIGASVNTEEQIALGLQFFPLYCSASVMTPQRWGISGVILDKPYFFARDADGRTAIIPPSNVSLAHTAMQ